ncbi:MAG TPA: hypothetical protein VLX29_00090 [Nitrospirota bacterium]|nr:hypothetical protein [Nitrospirota bacterium]
MGLKSDIDELKAVWSKSPWWFRIVIAMSILGNCSAIASLADTVGKWKGFFAEAVHFYRLYIGAPIRTCLKPFGIHLTSDATDVLVVILLLFGTCLRVQLSLTLKDKTAATIIIVPAMTIAAVLYVIAPNIAPKEMFFIFLLPPLMLPLTVYNEWRMDKTAPKFSAFIKLYYGQLIAYALFIGILGAINKGLYG